jgi:RHS repeat-associated protein
VRGKKGVDAYKINYNKVENLTGYTGTPLYNGNISETYWRTGSDNVQRKYGYKYDNLNRLRESIYQKPENANPVPKSYDENLTYDKNGNILSLLRNGDIDGALPANGIDNLIYSYPDNSNQLAKVTDVSNNTSGFKDGNKTGDDYTYDANGSLTTDKNKNITEIVYNHLNLPTKITFGATGNISFIYTASGQKVQKIVNSSLPTPTVTTTDYLGGFQYKGGVLQFFPTAEGYVEPNGSSFKYVFNYLDHLGNVRLSYSDSSQNGIIENSEIIQESNYYPGGLIQKGYNNTVTSTNPGQKLLFNGKELQDELDLDWYDFGARMLDKQLNIWRTIDPKSETSRRFSPYAYALCNPVYFIDPDGMQAEAGQSGNYYDWDEKAYKNKDTGASSTFEAAVASHSEGGETSPDNGYDENGKQINNNGGDKTDYVYNKDGKVVSSTSVKFKGSISSSSPLRGYGFKGFAMASGGLNEDNTIANFFIGGVIADFFIGKLAAKGGVTVIGEGMARVEAAAAKIPGAKILNTMPEFTGTAEQITSQMMQYNRQWLLNEMRSGRTIFDIGLDAARTNPSIFYQMEQNMIKNYKLLHP